MKYKLDKYELGCLIQCMNENNYCDNNRQLVLRQEKGLIK